MSRCNARKIRAAFPGKSEQPWHDATQLLVACYLCAISCFHTTGCDAAPTLLRQMNMGSLACAQLWVRAVHLEVGGVGGESGTNQSAQELTRKNRKIDPHLARHGVKPKVFGFEYRRSITADLGPSPVLLSSSVSLRVSKTP